MWEGNQSQNWNHPPGKSVSLGQGHREGALTTAAQAVKVGSQKTEANAAFKDTVKHIQVSAMKQPWRAKAAIRKFVLSA